ncbi:NfeD family protein [Pseudorhodoplanes sp.]|uniref:NfeD family protein n=1 Tax=Pseudorhodoplanes sp. TaxID=1934341 RepID=UPI003D09E0B4
MACRTVIAAGPVLILSPAADAQTLGEPVAVILESIGNPDAAFVLLIVGIYALLLEFANPGTFLPGLIGVICLTLAALALSALPVQYGALALLLAGIALMTAEAFTPGFGILGLLGFMAFVAGGYYLFDTPAGQIEMRVSMPLLFGSAVASAGLIFFVVGAAVKARQRPTATGSEQLLSEQGTVIDWSGDQGTIRIHGEVWSARAQRPLAPGDGVRVKSRDGLVLLVEPV